MNERIFKNVKRIMVGFGACILSFSFLFVPVLAYGSNVQSLIAEIPTNNLVSHSPTFQARNNKYYRYRIVSGNSTFTPNIQSENILSVPVGFVRYYSGSNIVDPGLLAYYSLDDFPTSTCHVYVCVDVSTDGGILWSQQTAYDLSSKSDYQYNDGGIVGVNLKYGVMGNPTSSGATSNNAYHYDFKKVSSDTFIPVIDYVSGVSYPTTILAVISGNLSYFPWQFSGTSGGIHFQDGTELDEENTSRYSQVFIVMDVNNDNSVTEEEVNYYNYTYNTNYDYSQVNQDSDFSQNEFLYWVATQINDGNENPGGGTGSGGGGSAVGGGGITVTDSFTQSQTQSIAENAVNVSINNNNSFDPENVNNLNSLINNNIGNQEGTNAVTEAVYNINLMTSLARKISSLIGIILGFLPWWASTIVGLMFSILAVMVVFRLIHLFI